MSLPASDPPAVFLDGRQRARLSGARHSQARDEAAVTYHYDTGNEFYRLFLGHWMTYSCAYFQSWDADLDTAQSAKLEHICRKLRLQPGERMLDIGCGWGGLALYAAKNYGVRVLGITLSKPQVEYGNAWLEREGLVDQARLEVRDYRELDPEEPFDKIVSVGMFEHVGREKLPDYFQSAWRALRPGGLFLNHGSRPNSVACQPGWSELFSSAASSFRSTSFRMGIWCLSAMPWSLPKRPALKCGMLKVSGSTTRSPSAAGSATWRPITKRLSA